MFSPLFVPLALLAAVTLVLTIAKAARLGDLEAEIQRRLHQEEIEHACKVEELETELERTRHGKPLTLGARDPQRGR
jgi:hypothetical protein